MTSKSTRSAGARNLNVDMTLVGHEPSLWYSRDGKRRENVRGPKISYFPDGQRLISESGDKTSRM